MLRHTKGLCFLNYLLKVKHIQRRPFPKQGDHKGGDKFVCILQKSISVIKHKPETPQGESHKAQCSFQDIRQESYKCLHCQSQRGPQLSPPFFFAIPQ